METFYNFDPERDFERLPDLLPSCNSVNKCDQSRTYRMHLSSDTPLDMHDLGRLLLINGKSWTQKIMLILECSKIVYDQLNCYQLDRIIWIELIHE